MADKMSSKRVQFIFTMTEDTQNIKSKTKWVIEINIFKSQYLPDLCSKKIHIRHLNSLIIISFKELQIHFLKLSII